MAVQCWVAYVRGTFHAVIAIGVVGNGCAVQCWVADFVGTDDGILSAIVRVGFEEAPVSIGETSLLRSTEIVCTYKPIGTVGMNRSDLAAEKPVAFVVGTEGVIVACCCGSDKGTSHIFVAYPVCTGDAILTEVVLFCMHTHIRDGRSTHINTGVHGAGVAIVAASYNRGDYVFTAFDGVTGVF